MVRPVSSAVVVFFFLAGGSVSFFLVVLISKTYTGLYFCFEVAFEREKDGEPSQEEEEEEAFMCKGLGSS